jgi:uncharacterized protein YidB (DUF937 family)
MGLFDILGGNSQQRSGMSPITMALLGLLAYRTFKGKNPNDMPNGGTAGGGGGGLGGLLSGGLGGLLGAGGAGGMLSGGLNDLLRRFQENGQGDKAESWIAHGDNKTISHGELEQALGQERVEWLMQQTGLPKEELLAGLSRELPQAVDRLTPDGRIPSGQEAEKLVA